MNEAELNFELGVSTFLEGKSQNNTEFAQEFFQLLGLDIFSDILYKKQSFILIKMPSGSLIEEKLFVSSLVGIIRSINELVQEFFNLILCE